MMNIEKKVILLLTLMTPLNWGGGSRSSRHRSPSGKNLSPGDVARKRNCCICSEAASGQAYQLIMPYGKRRSHRNSGESSRLREPIWELSDGSREKVVPRRVPRRGSAPPEQAWCGVQLASDVVLLVNSAEDLSGEGP